MKQSEVCVKFNLGFKCKQIRVWLGYKLIIMDFSFVFANVSDYSREFLLLRTCEDNKILR